LYACGASLESPIGLAEMIRAGWRAGGGDAAIIRAEVP